MQFCNMYWWCFVVCHYELEQIDVSNLLSLIVEWCLWLVMVCNLCFSFGLPAW